MSRPRGGYIGHNAAPAAAGPNSAASGVWTLREAEALKRAGTWPSAATAVVVVADLFNGAAGTPLTGRIPSTSFSSSAWQPLNVETSNSTLHLNGSGGVVFGQSDVYGNYGNNINSGRTNIHVQATIVSGGCAIWLRSTSGTNNYQNGYVGVFTGSGTVIIRRARFSSATLASDSTPVSVGSTVEIRAIDSQISALVNGNVVLSIADTAHSTGTFCGISVSGTDSASNFICYYLT